jgi:major membrane immunogen (membrane-anchored lipoprotein)
MKIVRSFLLVSIILVNTFYVECQKPDPKKKIKSIVVMEEKYNTLIKKQYKESETYFDSHGNIIEDIKYKDGKITRHFRYEYDTDNNKIKEEEFDPSGELKESSEYKYKDGLRVEKTVYDEDKKIKSRKNYQYTTF